MTSRAARWFIRRAIAKRTKQTDKLHVEVEARSNREAMQGRLDTVSVEFEKMSFPSIQVRKKIHTPRQILVSIAHHCISYRIPFIFSSSMYTYSYCHVPGIVHASGMYQGRHNYYCVVVHTGHLIRNRLVVLIVRKPG